LKGKLGIGAAAAGGSSFLSGVGTVLTAPALKAAAAILLGGAVLFEDVLKDDTTSIGDLD